METNETYRQSIAAVVEAGNWEVLEYRKIKGLVQQHRQERGLPFNRNAVSTAIRQMRKDGLVIMIGGYHGCGRNRSTLYRFLF